MLPTANVPTPSEPIGGPRTVVPDRGSTDLTFLRHPASFGSTTPDQLSRYSIAYFLGVRNPYKSRRTSLKAEIDRGAWESLRRARSRPFAKPLTGRIAVKVINHLGDEAMKVFRV